MRRRKVGPAGVQPSLQERDERYRMLVDSMDVGFCVIELAFEGERAVDYTFVETNRTFEEQTGLADAVGHSARELVPELEPHWFELYGAVAATGEPTRFVQGSDAMGRWFDVYAFRIGLPEGRQVGILFTDITERKEVEEAARLVAERDRFLAELGDAVRSLSEPEEIQLAAMHVLGRRLDVLRAQYWDVEPDGDHVVSAGGYTEGVPPVVERVRLDDVGTFLAQASRARRTLAVTDISNDSRIGAQERSAYEALGVRAFASVPIVEDGRLVAILGVHSGEPRTWTEDEVALLVETGDRTWATVERARAEQLLRRSHDTFFNLIQNSPLGVYLVDADFRLAQVSAGSQKVFENVRPLLGRDFEEVLRIVWPEPFASEAIAIFRHTLETGEPYHASDTTEQRGDIGEKESYDWQIERVELPDGRQGVVCYFYDFTELRRAEDALRESEERSRSLADAAREREATERQARETAELLTAVISGLEAVEGMEPRARTLVELLVPDIFDYAAVSFPSSSDGLVWAGAGEPSIVLALPIGAESEATLAFGRTGPADELSDGEVTLANAIAERAALLLGSARLRDEEHQTALRLQRALLPNKVFRHPSVDIAARYEAGSDVLEVGGDWYDSFALQDGRIGIAVGDVVGHGLDAAASMGRMRTALAALAHRSKSPSEVLTSLDQFALGPNGTDFATACYAVLDPSTGELRYASAGHPPMLVVDPSGASRWLDGGRSLPLGLAAVDGRGEASTVLDPGALLLLYSDGLVERPHERLTTGLARLEKLTLELRDEPLQDVCERLIAEMSRHQPSADDAVAMCVRLADVPAKAFRGSYPARAEELRRIRSDIREWLGVHGVDRRMQDDALLALGEACANAVEHAYPGSRGMLEIDVELGELVDELLIRVRDFGAWRDDRARDDDRGRGTAIMEALASDFTRDTDADGTVVTLRLSRPAEGSE